MHRSILVPSLLLAALVWQGCQTTPPPSSFTFRPDKLAAMDSTNLLAIAERRMPGAVLWLEHEGVVYRKAFAQRAIEPLPEPMTEDTVFDAASLTKVIATAPAVMI